MKAIEVLCAALLVLSAVLFVATGCGSPTPTSRESGEVDSTAFEFLSRLFEEPDRDRLKQQARSAAFLEPWDMHGASDKSLHLASVRIPGRPLEGFVKLHTPPTYGATTVVFFPGQVGSETVLLNSGAILRFDENVERVESGGLIAVGRLDDMVVCLYVPTESRTIDVNVSTFWRHRIVQVKERSVTAVTFRDTDPSRTISRRAWKALLRSAGL